MVESAEVRDRIALLRFVMIFGVVVLHTPEYVPVTEIGHGWFDLFKAFFQNALFRATVPVLTFLSGYLLFRSGLDQQPAKLARKKTASLLVPFLCFNLPLLCLAYVAETIFGLRLSYDLRTHDLLTWLDAAFGLTHSPINYPLNFLRDMIVLMCLAPLFGLLIRRAPYSGLAAISVLFMTNLDGPLILREVMPLTFYVGGMAAVHKWNICKLDRFAVPLGGALVMLCVAIVYFRIANTTFLRIVSPVLIWPAASLLTRTRFGAWCARMQRHSFLLFSAHAPILLGLWLVFKALGRPGYYAVFWTLAPVLVTFCIVQLHGIGLRLAPNLFPLLLGGRSSVTGRRKAPSVRDPEPAQRCINDTAHDSPTEKLVY